MCLQASHLTPNNFKTQQKVAASNNGRTRLSRGLRDASGSSLPFFLKRYLSSHEAIKLEFCSKRIKLLVSELIPRERYASASDFSGDMEEDQILRGSSGRFTKILLSALQIYLCPFSVLQHVFYVWYVGGNGRTNAYRLFDIVFYKY